MPSLMEAKGVALLQRLSGNGGLYVVFASLLDPPLSSILPILAAKLTLCSCIIKCLRNVGGSILLLNQMVSLVRPRFVGSN